MPKSSVRDLPYEVWALLVGMFTVALGYGVVAPVLPAYALEFDVTFAAASAIISAFAVMRVIFAPASGVLVRHFGERRIYIIGILIVAVTTGSAAFATDYWQLLTLRALAGIGSTMFSVAAMGLLIKLSPVDARARVASLNSGSFMSGAVLGPLLGALFAGFGLRAPLIVYAIMLVIAATIVAISLRNSSIVSRDEHQTTHTVMTLRQAFRVSQYRATLGSSFAHGWATIGVRSALIPLFTVVVLGESATAAGWMLTAFAIANLAVLFPSGRLADRIGRKPLILVGLAVASVGLSSLALTHELGWALILAAVWGIGSAFMVPAQQAVLADVLGKDARGGQVLAAYQMSTDLGAVIGPILTGLVVDVFGFDEALFFTSSLFIISGIIWLFTPDSRSLQVTSKTGTIPVQPDAT